MDIYVERNRLLEKNSIVSANDLFNRDEESVCFHCVTHYQNAPVPQRLTFEIAVEFFQESALRPVNLTQGTSHPTLFLHCSLDQHSARAQTASHLTPKSSHNGIPCIMTILYLRYLNLGAIIVQQNDRRLLAVIEVHLTVIKHILPLFNMLGVYDFH